MAAVSDILIIGRGPAGLSAASSIVRQDNTITMFDSGEYRNGTSTHLHTVPGWDHRDPAEFRAAARKDFARYGTVTVENVKVETVIKRDDGLFEATAGGKTWVGKKVILATGVEDIFPDIDGYAECWVKAIFHCLYCHGWEEKGAQSAGILAEGDAGSALIALHFARQALPMAKQVTLYTHGNEQLAKDLNDALQANPAPMTINSKKIIKLTKGPERTQITLHFEDGSEQTEAFLAHKPKTKLRGPLIEGLEMTPMGTIKVNPPFNQTSMKGVFAAGDCTSPMHFVSQALFSGTCVGGGAPLQIQAETYNQPAIFK